MRETIAVIQKIGDTWHWLVDAFTEKEAIRYASLCNARGMRSRVYKGTDPFARKLGNRIA